MGLDALLAKLQREAVTPVTPSISLGVTAEALLLLAVPSVTPVTSKNRKAGEKAEPEPSRQAENGESLTRPYISGVTGVTEGTASNGAGSGVTPTVTDGVTRVTNVADLLASAVEPDERDLGRAGDERTGDNPDERRFCTQCLNLRGAVCIVAKPGGLVSAIVGYRPGLPDMLQRCAGYAPNADDPDQRPGRERWPGLTHRGTRHADH